MELWPSDFPMPATTLGAATAANTIRTQMESGTIRQRRRFSAELVFADVTWSLSDTELGVLSAFHKHKLNLGADWFQMMLPLGGGMNLHVVRFEEGKYSQTYQEVGYWEVRASLEIQERAVFSPQVLQVYLDIGFSEQNLTNLIDAVDDFHYCVHHTLPTNLN